jgi:ribosomal protein L24
LVPEALVKAGDRVLVIGGACRGDVGAVKGLSPYTFEGERVWFVQLDGFKYQSQIRETFLAPEPTKSDEDVLGPLRNQVPG